MHKYGMQHILELSSHKPEHSISVDDHCAEFCHLLTFFSITNLYLGNILWQKITYQKTKHKLRIVLAMWFVAQNTEARQYPDIFQGAKNVGDCPERQHGQPRCGRQEKTTSGHSLCQGTHPQRTEQLPAQLLVWKSAPQVTGRQVAFLHEGKWIF